MDTEIGKPEKRIISAFIAILATQKKKSESMKMNIIKVDKWDDASLSTGAIQINAKTVDEAAARFHKVWPDTKCDTVRYCERENELWCYFEVRK